MTEKKLQWLELSKLLWVIVFAFLYQYGGMEMKWLRRFLAPTILACGMFVYSKNWKCLLQAPLMMITLSLGYGSDSTSIKIIKRGIFGLLNGSTSSIKMWCNKEFLLASFHTILILSAYIILGVWNPLPSARAEELVLGFLLAFLPMMSIKIKGT